MNLKLKMLSIVAITFVLLAFSVFTTFTELNDNQKDFRRYGQLNKELEFVNLVYMAAEQTDSAIKGIYMHDNDSSAINWGKRSLEEFKQKWDNLERTAPDFTNIVASDYNNVERIFERMLDKAASGKTLSLEEVDNIGKTWLVLKEKLDKELDAYQSGVSKIKHEYDDEINELKTKTVTINIIVILILVSILIYLQTYLLKAVNAITSGLNNFFNFLNQKTDIVEPINFKSKDEFGQMATQINENINMTKIGLEKDKESIITLLNTVNLVKTGDLNYNEPKEANNKQINQLLKASLEMLDYIKLSVGADFNKIKAIFDEYSNRNFTAKIDNAKGEVEVMTNRLGDVIVDILKANLEVSNQLQNKSETLSGAVENLNGSTKKQASSLEESVAAIEEMSSSMNSIASMSEEVIKQSDDIKGIVTDRKSVV